MKNIVFVFGFMVVIWFAFFHTNEVVYPEGILAPLAPSQKDLKSAPTISFKDYKITPLATFGLKAKVLAKKNYHFGKEADLSPTDLALGWNKMSDQRIVSSIDISQSGRWYFWRSSSESIPDSEIAISSANMHIIPFNKEIESTLKNVRKGDIVQISGLLVKVEGDNGWRWVSSLSRNDTGDGACELILVNRISIIQG